MSGKPGQNANFKICARLKPVQYGSEILEISGTDTIRLRSNNLRRGEDDQTFHYNKAFTELTNQESLYAYMFENSINKVLDGANSCIISYGQTSSGKTYSIFGEDERYTPSSKLTSGDPSKDRRGLVPRTVEYFLNYIDENDDKEFIVVCTFAEIYLEKVRDLGAAFNKETVLQKSNQTQSTFITSYEQQDLEVQEDTTGHIHIKNITNIPIKTMDDLYRLLSAGFTLREKVENKGIQLSQRAHTIFTVSVRQRDGDSSSQKGMIQFVDLAGSERVSKNIADGTAGLHESVIVSKGLQHLCKVLYLVSVNSKNIPYRDSKVTKSLYNTLGPYNNIILLCNLHPGESNYEECKLTLHYGEKCKTGDFIEKKLGVGISDNEYNPGERVFYDKQTKKLYDEIAELKLKIENIYKDQKIKMDRVKSVLGLDIDFDKLSQNAASKELNYLNRLKDSLIENENLKGVIEDMKIQMAEAAKKSDERMQQDRDTQRILKSEIHTLRNALKKVEEGHLIDKRKMEEELNIQVRQIQTESFKMVEDHSKSVFDKVKTIDNFQSKLLTKTRMITNALEDKSSIRRDTEEEFKKDFSRIREECNNTINTLRAQYESILKTKDEEMEKYAEETKDYMERKKEQIKQYENEIVELFKIIQKQNAVIERVEGGYYSSGIRSFNIPLQDKVEIPARKKFPALFQMLDKKKVDSTILSFYQTAKNDDMRFNTVSGSSTERLRGKNFSSPITKIERNVSYSNLQDSSRRYHEDKDKSLDEGYEFLDLDIKIESLLLPDLRTYTANLKKQFKKLREKLRELEKMNIKYTEVSTFNDLSKTHYDKGTPDRMSRLDTKRSEEKSFSFKGQKKLIQTSTGRILMKT